MSAFVVRFKNEDEIDGVPIGPVTVYTQAELEASRGRIPFDPDRDVRWVSLPEARAIAQEHDTVLEET